MSSDYSVGNYGFQKNSNSITWINIVTNKTVPYDTLPSKRKLFWRKFLSRNPKKITYLHSKDDKLFYVKRGSDSSKSAILRKILLTGGLYSLYKLPVALHETYRQRKLESNPKNAIIVNPHNDKRPM